MASKLVVLVAFASAVAHAWPGETCRDLMKRLVDHLMVEERYGDAIPLGDGTSVKPVPATLHPGGKLALKKDQFMKFGDTTWYSPDAIYIGVSSHYREGDFHAYLIAGNLRLDGPGGLGKVLVHNSPDGKVPLASEGVLFKIPVTPEKRKAIMAAIAESAGDASTNCVAPIQKILAAHGVSIEATNKDGTESFNALATNLMFGQVLVDKKKADVALLGTSQDAINYYAMQAETIDERLRNEEKKKNQKEP